MFTRDSATVSLAVSDVGVLVIQALERISPSAAKRVPPNLETQLVRISDGSEQALTQALQIAEGIRFLAIACLILAALAAGGRRAVGARPPPGVRMDRAGRGGRRGWPPCCCSRSLAWW